MQHRSMTWVIYPDAAQRRLMAQYAGARRFAYNTCCGYNRSALAERTQQDRPKLSFSVFDNIAWWNAWKRKSSDPNRPELRDDRSWIKELPQEIFEEAVVDFGRAMTSWARSKKAKKLALDGGRQQKDAEFRKKVGFPRFRKKSDVRQSFRMRVHDKNPRFLLSPDGIKVPHLGLLRIKQKTRKIRRMVYGKGSTTKLSIVQVTFRRDEAEKRWYVTVVIKGLLAEQGARLQPDGRLRIIGCDVGIKTLVTTATLDGKSHHHHKQPKTLLRAEKRLRNLHRALGIKRLSSEETKIKKGLSERIISKKERTSKKKLDSCYRKTRNIRVSHLHELTTGLVKSHDIFGMESLQIGNMVKNKRLSRAIARQGWQEFFRQMTYKAAWAGKTVVCAPRFFPSTRRCSRCGHVVGSIPLSVRLFSCDSCKFELDRDVNAAVNTAWYAEQTIRAREVLGKHVKKPDLA
jgi:putative transposase